MRRAAAVSIVCFLILVVPSLLVEGKKGNEQGQGGGASDAPTFVTFLEPLVALPATVVSLEFIQETDTGVKRSSSANQDPMKFAAGDSRSVAAHLWINGSGVDLGQELAALFDFANASGRSNSPATMVLVWGKLGAYNVKLEGFGPRNVSITHNNEYRHNQADLEFLMTRAEVASNPPRDFLFGEPGLGLPVYVLELAADQQVNWTPSREPRGDAPELEFSSAEGRSMSFELMFDTYEQGESVQPSVELLLSYGFDSPAPLATRPVNFSLGDTKLRGMVESAAVRFTMFLPDGTPVRAHLTLRLVGVHESKWRFTVSEPAEWEGPELGLPSTVIAMNLWRNVTDANGAERVEWHKHATFDSKPFKFPQDPVNASGQFFFDGYESKTNLSKMLEPLLNLTGSNDSDRRPPRVRVVWGGGLPAFEGVLESISTKYTMFLPDGTPTRATVNVQLREAERAEENRSRFRGDSHHGTKASAEGTQETDPNHANATNITFKGPFAGANSALLDWALDLGSTQGTAMDVRISFKAQVPANGTWQCTWVRFIPPQVTGAGILEERIIIRAELSGPKGGEAPTFGEEVAMQHCRIDATHRSSERGKTGTLEPDQPLTMKGFTVDIAGRPSPAETFLGGALVIELVPDPNNAGHYGPGKARVGAVTLTRTDENRTDWSDWFKASNETQGGERRNVTVAFTDQTGAIVMVFMLWGALPVWQGFTLDGKGTDVDVEEIRLCVEEFERG